MNPAKHNKITGLRLIKIGKFPTSEPNNLFRKFISMFSPAHCGLSVTVSSVHDELNCSAQCGRVNRL